jgi:hypothetical protein
MPKYAEVLVALPGFRNDLMQRQQLEAPGVRSAMIARGAFAAFASPLSNVHATGAGIRQRRGSYDSEEVVLKVFVFDKVDARALGEKPEKSWQGIPIDYEHLPVQMIRPRKSREREKPRSARRSAVAVEAVAGQRERLRPIVGGLSISPIDVQFVGTLGCFLRRRRVDGEDIFALSNNHVLADTDRLPRGTRDRSARPRATSGDPT